MLLFQATNDILDYFLRNFPREFFSRENTKTCEKRSSPKKLVKSININDFYLYLSIYLKWHFIFLWEIFRKKNHREVWFISFHEFFGLDVLKIFRPSVNLHLTTFTKHLLGHTPGATEISSIAILPRLFFPTIPSNTIWKKIAIFKL